MLYKKLLLFSPMKNTGEILAALLKNYNDCYVFLHNTREKEIAEIIMSEGFLFENQLPYSTDLVNPMDPVQVTYFLLQRREYGNFTIVIAIGRELFDDSVSHADRDNTVVEEVLSAEAPYTGENEELIYRLPNSFVAGYFDNRTSEFKTNPGWDPLYNNINSSEHQH